MTSQGLLAGAAAPATVTSLGAREREALEQLVSFALNPKAGLAPLDPEVLQRALASLRTGANGGRSAQPATIHEQVASRIRGLIGDGHAPADPNALNRALALLAQWRVILLGNTYVTREGSVVFGGLFRGMRYLERSSQGMLLSRLLGTYESELHPHFDALLRDGLDAIIDVGCAEGYYAVGLARLAPGVEVHAHDIDENARALCAELARRNDVADRVKIGGEFKPADFQAFAGRRVLVLVDAEGAEAHILDPAQSPALAEMAIVVETHEIFRPGVEALLVARFSPTHEITRVLPGPKAFDMPDWMREITDLDQLLGSWEYRGKPTPWLVMRPRQRSGAAAQ